MGDIDAEDTLELQAAVLAKRTVRAPLDQLAQLCPLAERVIEDLLHVQTPDPEILSTLGLRNEGELRAFVERVILVGTASPQDHLAQYLFQGQEAGNAGINPRDWIFQVHRPLRTSVLHYLYQHQRGGIPPALQARYALDLPAIIRDLDELVRGQQPGGKPSFHDPYQEMIEARLRYLPQLELLFRKGAAMRLMAARIERLQEETRRQQTAPPPAAAAGTAKPRARIPTGANTGWAEGPPRQAPA